MAVSLFLHIFNISNFVHNSVNKNNYKHNYKIYTLV